MELKYEVDQCTGRFRIGREGVWSLWTPYTSSATLELDGILFVAGTEYGLVPDRVVVYELVPHSPKASSLRSAGTSAKEEDDILIDEAVMVVPEGLLGTND